MAIPKKNIFIIFAVLLTLLSVSSLCAQTVPAGLEFEIIDGISVTITKYSGNAATVNIPARIQGLPVTVIGDSAFYGLGSLTSITIPSSVTSIADLAFFNCNSLTSITLPSSVKSIGDSAFAACGILASITIPSSVTSIGNLAFCDCDSLSSITIPSSVAFIGNGAFAACNSLPGITVDSSNPSFVSRDGVLFDKNIQTIVGYPSGRKAETYAMPSSVTSIDNWAFSFCYNLTSITIPSSVIFIADLAFFNCESLTSVTISRHTQIGSNAFPETTQIIYRD